MPLLHPCAAPRRRRRSSQSGSQVVEFAVTLPMMLLLVLGMVDFGLLLQADGVVNNAGREGARLAILEGEGFTLPVVQSRVAQYIAAGLPAGSATPTVDVAPWPLTVGTLKVPAMRVTVVYPYTFTFVKGIAALFGGSFTTVNITAVATMRQEAPAE